MLDSAAFRALLHDLSRPIALVRDGEGFAVAQADCPAARFAAFVPALPYANLGDATFRRDHGLRANYVTGAMANGIASVELVAAISAAGMLGFFGAAGQSLPRIAQAIDELEARVPRAPWGVNLIHSPNEPDHEMATVELLLQRQVRLIEASAYLDLTLPVVRYRLAGIRRGADGRIELPNRIVAKVSRVEVASKFLAPAPEKLVAELVHRGELTPDQAELARRVPVAQDLTAEADSGGHTDNRPLVALLPTLLALRDRLQGQYQYEMPLRVGAAGGLATPAGVAAAFALGAAYVVTGSVNQACVESGSSNIVRKMLAEAGQADVTMAPAADMFEMGVKLQVLKRGTMFAMRAARLYDLYRAYPSLEAIPPAERARAEKDIFRAPLESIWAETRQFWLGRDPKQVERAEADPKHRLALVCRWYLGLSSRWANAGDAARQTDFQVWCGPAMGAFNEWSKGSFLEFPENRQVVAVARNLMHGAAVTTRVHMLSCQGVKVSPEVSRASPREDL